MPQRNLTSAHIKITHSGKHLSLQQSMEHAIRLMRLSRRRRPIRNRKQRPSRSWALTKSRAGPQDLCWTYPQQSEHLIKQLPTQSPRASCKVSLERSKLSRSRETSSVAELCRSKSLCMKGLASLTPLGYNCPSRRWYSLANLCYCQPTCCLDDTASEVAIQMRAGVKPKED